MGVWLILSGLILVVVLLGRKNERLLNYGKRIYCGYIKVNLNQYYVEEVNFDTYQEALSKYFNVVSDITNYGTVLDEKHDLYDWTYTILRFKDATIEVRNIRPLKKIKLVKSLKPMTIKEFELDNAIFH